VSDFRDIRELLDRALGSGVLSRDGINYCLRCPACKDARTEKRKLVVRLDDGRYHCWVCGIKGLSVNRLIAKFRPGFASDARNVRLRKGPEEQQVRDEEVTLPKGTVLLGGSGNQGDPDIKAVTNYLKRRGLSRKDMLRWRALSCSRGSFRRRAIIPSFDREGKINYYVARSIDPDTKMKYQNAKIAKEDIIFNEVDLDWSKEMILVEGVLDAMKCPENSVPVLGSSLSTRSRLYKMLMRHQTPCIVSLDPDLKKKAFKLADLLSATGCSVKIAFAPSGRDLGDLSREAVLGVLSHAKPYTDMMRISHKISEMSSGSLL